MADFWWNPDDTLEEDKAPAISSGFGNRDRNRTGVPEGFEPISAVRDGNLGGSSFHYRKTDNGVEFWNAEAGRPAQGDEIREAQGLYQELEARRDGEVPEEVAERQRAIDTQAERTPASSDTDTAENLSFDRFGNAVLKTSSYGALRAETVEMMSVQDARAIIRDDLGMEAPSGQNPRVFLREYLRNQRR